ncbi:MAG TPA: glycosyltransferase [Pyrinomonadaceae bacterium]|nr:glycosyltransferase [Pyrinomonadaceae bacterium]
MRRFLSERLPLAWKLRLRRAAFAPVAWALRASGRARDFAARLREGAGASGFDSVRTRDADARTRDTHVEPFGAADFLLLAHAARAREDEGVAYGGEGPGGARAFKTSIVVAVGGEVESTFQCLRSLVREVDLAETEVIVVNDASSASVDLTRELLSHFRGLVRVIENADGGDDSPNRDFPDEWARFVEACNRGAARARGTYLLFLKADAVVNPGWLGALVETLERDGRAGAAGSLSLDARGRVREAGGIVWSDGETFGYGRGWSAEDRRVAFAREVDFCSAASLAVRRDLFERLGGFDAGYASGVYAAAGLCMGVRSLGRRVVYQPASRVTSLGDARGVSGRERAADRERFRDEWRAALAREHVAHDASDLERAANRKWATQVAVFDDCVPTPDRDAGSARMLHILRALSEWSHVVLITLSKQSRPDYERALWREGVETAPAPDFLRLVRARRFRAAILSRPHVAAGLLGPIRRAGPRTRIVFDMVDAHSLRLSREHELTGDADVAREAERYRAMESRLARECDLVWCASSADEEFMRRLSPGIVATVVPTIHPRHGRGLPFEGREHILFVGNFRHRPNADAVHFYAREVLPRVRESLPRVELLLVGDNAPKEFAGYEGAGVRVLGYVPDIEPVFARARVSVAPLRFGAGINGKIGEALAHGLPVVTTNVGAAGLALRDGEEALIADSPEDLAAASVRLYTDAALWRRLSDKGYEHVERHFSPRVVRKVVNDSVRGILGHFEESLTAPREPAGTHTPE